MAYPFLSLHFYFIRGVIMNVIEAIIFLILIYLIKNGDNKKS